MQISFQFTHFVCDIGGSKTLFKNSWQYPLNSLRRSNRETNSKYGSNYKRGSWYNRILELQPVIYFVEIFQFKSCWKKPVLPAPVYPVAIEVISCIFGELMPVFSEAEYRSDTKIETTFFQFELHPRSHMNTSGCYKSAILIN
jgi:hypothetical protein